MKKAFTLAEVLVTLGVLGVVAALTMPNLMKGWQNRSYVTQLRKVHTELSQATEQAMADDFTQTFKATKAIRQGTPGLFLETYFKTIETCDADDAAGKCFADSYSTIEGKSVRLRDILSSDHQCAVVASGYSICLNTEKLIAVTDINGKQKPNVYGRDLFLLFVHNDGTVGSANMDDNLLSDPTSCIKGGYSACIDSIIQNGWVMDY